MGCSRQSPDNQGSRRQQLGCVPPDRILLVLLIVDDGERVVIRDVLDHQIICRQFERLEAIPELIHNGGIANVEIPKE